MKEKVFEVVLKKKSAASQNERREFRAVINEDVRFWHKNEPIRREYSFRIPSDIPSGKWDVYLGLSSAYMDLRANPAYSVHIYNTAWDAGLNKIGTVNITAVGRKAGIMDFKQITE